MDAARDGGTNREVVMRNWRRHVRGTFGTALKWAAAGALVGAAVEVVNDLLPRGLPMASLVDIWPAVLAVAGFLGGACASALLRLAEELRPR